MKMMDAKRIFIDTNILIYATNALSPWQGTAIRILEKAKTRNVELIVSHQVLREYLASATRISLTAGDILLSEILENIKTFQTNFTLVAENSRVLAQLVELIKEVPIAGKQVHDANIVATMLVYGINSLLTYNMDDFKRFSGKIQLLAPEDWVNREVDDNVS
jgi:predicted nucleic acid-binding protein